MSIYNFYVHLWERNKRAKRSDLRIHQSKAETLTKGAIFSSLALISKHSCGIFTGLFSHVNTTSETGDWELCWNSASTYHQSCGGPRLPLRGCQSGVWSGGGSLKNVCHCSAKVVKRKPHLLQWLSVNRRRECVLIPMCEWRVEFQKIVFAEMLFTSVKVGCCLCVAWLTADCGNEYQIKIICFYLLSLVVCSHADSLLCVSDFCWQLTTM